MDKIIKRKIKLSEWFKMGSHNINICYLKWVFIYLLNNRQKTAFRDYYIICYGNIKNKV